MHVSYTRNWESKDRTLQRTEKKEMGQGECQSGKKSHVGEMKPRSSFILSDSELSGVSCAPQGSLGGNTAFSNASHGPQWDSP